MLRRAMLRWGFDMTLLRCGGSGRMLRRPLLRRRLDMALLRLRVCRRMRSGRRRLMGRGALWGGLCRDFFLARLIGLRLLALTDPGLREPFQVSRRALRLPPGEPERRQHRSGQECGSSGFHPGSPRAFAFRPMGQQSSATELRHHCWRC
jgi:hypothetical protein